jgi:two-component system, cell cycle sensor histidine kinase and response regulator CckA
MPPKASPHASARMAWRSLDIALGVIALMAVLSFFSGLKGWLHILPILSLILLAVCGLVFRLVRFINRAEREQDHYDSQVFLESIVENIPDMIFVKEAESLRFVRFNKAGEQLIGHPREALIGKNDFDFFTPTQARFFIEKDRDVLAQKKLIDIAEERIQTPRGERVLHTKKIPVCDETGRPQYLLGISEDITQRKKEEYELQQSRKLNTLGRLAAGVAHEINNPLSVILGFAQSLVKHTGIPEADLSALRSIEQEAIRCRTLVQDLLQFSRARKSGGGMQEDPVKILDSALSLVGTQAKIRGIDVKREVIGNIPHATMDATQIQQVIINLCSNALDAMAKGGVLTVGLFSEGDELKIRVSDTGQGIPPDIRDKIFDPFFTTKEAGKGTGIGLSLVFDIVQKHHGTIELQSELGQGTTFTVRLPLALPPDAAVAA